MHVEQTGLTSQSSPTGEVVPRTQDAAVDEILHSLVEVDGLSLREQVALLDDAHQRLQGRLAESDGGAR
ncbi:MAG: hypothetical protein FWD18_07330 [Micrococcales bacterium]|nr:hypothetical protein [Micrococcales bacterium]